MTGDRWWLALRDLVNADMRYDRAQVDAHVIDTRTLHPVSELAKAARARREALKRAHQALHEGGTV